MAAPFDTIALDATEARRLLDYNSETGEFFWRVKRGKMLPGSIAGGLNKKGYWVIRIDFILYYGHRLAWLIMKGEWPSVQIDHENEIKSDNIWTNLREATNQQNKGNVTSYSNNTSGFKGVSFDKSRNKYEASISINCKKKHLGRFDTPELASAAYAEAAKIHFGEFSKWTR